MAQKYKIFNVLCTNKARDVVCYSIENEHKLPDECGNMLPNILKVYYNKMTSPNKDLYIEAINRQKEFDHINVCKVYEIDYQHIDISVVYENCGVELFYYLMFNYVSLINKKRIINQILDGVEYLFSKHYYHPDLKVENICINQLTKVVKIIDFDHSCGTSYYMPPERMRLYVSKTPLTHHSNEYENLWTLGVIIYCLLEEKMPFNKHDEIINCKYNKDTKYHNDIYNMFFKQNPKERPTIPVMRLIVNDLI